jgi:site-specific DNA-methyltransferase (adenine-specific)
MVDYIKQGDCLELMKELPDKSIDMILCDLPYGTTDCKWDTIIPFEPLWEQYNRIVKDNGTIVLFSRQPFTSQLINSNLKMYRYELIWQKEQATNFLHIKKQFGQATENIEVFYKHQPTYNPQMVKTDKPIKSNGGNNSRTYNNQTFIGSDEVRYEKYPLNVLTFKRDKTGLHPTQKPVELCEYLIKTYTNENETVLDNCMGSGSTCVAAINTNRHYIGFELDPHYFEIAQKRIEEAKKIKGQAQWLIT